jgi:glucose-6-phosphate isomerase
VLSKDLASKNRTSAAAFAALQRHAKRMKIASLRALFEADPKRFDRFTVAGAGLHLDFSKNLIVPETLELLIGLAEAAGIAERRNHDGSERASSNRFRRLPSLPRRPRRTHSAR